MGRIALKTCLVLAAASLLIWWTESSFAGGYLEGVASGPHGDRSNARAAAKTLETIKRLQAESLEQSLENADYVDDYYFPGYYSEGFLPLPIDSVHTILSNRRTSKLYEQLKPLPPDMRHALLTKYFNKFLLQYWGIIDKFKAGATPSGEDVESLTATIEKRGGPRTAAGTRHAVRSLALLSGMLGDARMWPVLKPVFQQPTYGRDIAETAYDRDAIVNLQLDPLLPESVRAEVLYLMAQNAPEGETAVVGLDRKAILRCVPGNQTKIVTLQSYRAEITAYDLLRRVSAAPLDLGKGSHKLRFLMSNDRAIFLATMRAAGV